MWVRRDDRLVLVRACGLWHQGFAKEGGGDIDKDVSYNHVFDSLLFDKTQMNGKYCVDILIQLFHYYMRYAIDSRKLQKELGWEPSL